MKERADAARNRAAILQAASRLFDDAADPSHVSMDDIAIAAGVGKGTLFRRFGDRSALLLAVFEQRLGQLRDATRGGPPPLGPGTPPKDRIVAVLSAIVLFKLQNRRLAIAVESAGGSWAGLYNSPQYTEMHRLLSDQLTQLSWSNNPDWTAHALLAATRIDLVDHLVGDGGMTADHVLAELRAHVDRLLRD